MTRIFFVATLLGVGLACSESTEPCDRYVDYMCDCHANDDGFDCQQLTEAYEGADQQVQDECAIELDDQKQADKDAEFACGGTTTTAR